MSYVMTSNTANSNTGFEFTIGSWNNVLLSNSAKSNGNDGFYFDKTTSGNWVVGNSASGNSNYDAEQQTGANNLFGTNTFTHTSDI